ncbi:LexA family transcriptional regulator [Escherichia albertii]|uniref:HumD family translesion DNA polymerase n=1 Tax=Escherichia albertii TaxID=208962 RepID=UPI00211A9AB2|nr:LexA family transcriptional regulator [Escherichia albertii]MCQ9003203.1 LexA family transcriptional regulator [Escherichia albertii]WDB67060.1 LexA family transcriptional regulator [Escherichia albertii]
MGFPSPAADYIERSISLDVHIAWVISGIMNGAFMVVDSSLKPCDGSLLVCRIGDELRIKRYRISPTPHLVNLENGKREEIPVSTGYYNVTSPVFVAITYIINDVHSGEFDDYPLK